jgi:hypothetical protein
MVSQYLDAVFVGPIVENPTKEVNICPFYRLFREEIVCHETDTTR